MFCRMALFLDNLVKLKQNKASKNNQISLHALVVDYIVSTSVMLKEKGDCYNYNRIEVYDVYP